MKTKILPLFTVLFFASLTINAQFNDGRYLIGGGINFYSEKGIPYALPPYPSSPWKNETLNTIIQFGKVIKYNTTAGLILSYENFSNSPLVDKSNELGFGVFYRKYKTLAKNFYVFGEGDLVYFHSTGNQGQLEIGEAGMKEIYNGSYLSFTPGLSYSFSKRANIELLIPGIVSLSYTKIKTEGTNTGNTSISITKGNNFSVIANLQTTVLNNFGIGFKFFLGK